MAECLVGCWAEQRAAYLVGPMAEDWGVMKVVRTAAWKAAPRAVKTADRKAEHWAEHLGPSKVARMAAMMAARRARH